MLLSHLCSEETRNGTSRRAEGREQGVLANLCVYNSQEKSLFSAGCFLSLSCSHQRNCSIQGAQRDNAQELQLMGKGGREKMNNFLLLPYALNPFRSLAIAKVRNSFFSLAILMLFRKSQISKAKEVNACPPLGCLPSPACTQHLINSPCRLQAPSWFYHLDQIKE